MFPWNFSPFNKKSNNLMGQLNPNDMEKFIKQIMEQMMPKDMQGMFNNTNWLNPNQNGNQPNEQAQNQSSESLSYSVFDTHNDVFVRISIKDESWLSQLKLFHTSNQLIVEHIPNQNDKYTITLPSIVRKKGTVTTYKDQILEVRIPKNVDMQFSEIEIPE
ncbi:Hsp20/alpha crystallin family protein [Pseudoneobacillus sp. C159]